MVIYPYVGGNMSVYDDLKRVDFNDALLEGLLYVSRPNALGHSILVMKDGRDSAICHLVDMKTSAYLGETNKVVNDDFGKIFREFAEIDLKNKELPLYSLALAQFLTNGYDRGMKNINVKVSDENAEIMAKATQAYDKISANLLEKK